MPAMRISRRAALAAPRLAVSLLAVSLLAVSLLAVSLAGCGGPPPPTTFETLGWEYLPRLRLNVASIAVDDSWTPRAGTREVGFLAPTPPLDALRRMAQDRLFAGGNSGQAKFVIENAAIVQTGDAYAGTFAVRLDVGTSDGERSGFAEARVSRTRAIRDASPAGARAELYDLVKQMMADMNVEFEYQVRHSLGDYLQATQPEAPPAGPVEQQDLTPPGGGGTASPSPGEGAPAAPAAAPAAPHSAVPFASPEPVEPAP